MANETPSRPPPPFMANAILNFHFDFPHPSLICQKSIFGSTYSKCYHFIFANILTMMTTIKILTKIHCTIGKALKEIGN